MKCGYCHDTGSLARDPHGSLDCVHCDVARDRAILNAWATMEGILRWSDGVSSWHLWLIYQHGIRAGISQAMGRGLHGHP